MTNAKDIRMIDLQEEVALKKKSALGHLLSRAGRLMTSHALEEVHDAGFPEVREGWLSILRFVEDDGIRSIDLAKKLNVSKQAANHMVKELEAVGYVERQPDPRDQRARLIQLTPKGYQAWLIGLASMKTLETKLEEHLGAHLVTELQQGCTSLLQTLEMMESGEDSR